MVAGVVVVVVVVAGVVVVVFFSFMMAKMGVILIGNPQRDIPKRKPYKNIWQKGQRSLWKNPVYGGGRLADVLSLGLKTDQLAVFLLHKHGNVTHSPFLGQSLPTDPGKEEAQRHLLNSGECRAGLHVGLPQFRAFFPRFVPF